jgi:hypothetical protein
MEGLVRAIFMTVFNSTINIISVISTWSDLFVEETFVTKNNHRPAVIH